MMDQHSLPEMNDVIEQLRSLKGLEPEEVTEEAMLRARIEQQCDVISVLKQRADQYLTKNLDQENEIEALRDSAKELKERLEEEQRALQLIQHRFKVLDDNHQEMIKLKDEFKSQNTALLMENARLVNENEAGHQEKVKRIQEQLETVQVKLREAEDEAAHLKERERSLMAFAESEKQGFQKKIGKVERAVAEESARLTELLEKAKSERDSSVKHMEEIAERQRNLTADNVALRANVKTLESRLVTKEAEIRSMKTKLESELKKSKEAVERARKEAEARSANAQVCMLRASLAEAQAELDSQAKEFEAYKLHSNHLLEKEKDLNKKLRRLHVPGL